MSAARVTAFIALGANVDLMQEVINLTLNWFDNDLWIDQTCRANYLLDNISIYFRHLVLSRRS